MSACAAVARARLLLMTLLFVLASCAPLARKTLPPEATRVSGPELESILARLQAADQSISSFRGLARTIWEYAGEKQGMRYAIAFERPNRLRVEMMPTTAAYTLAMLSTSEAGGVFIDVQAREAYKSAEADELIRRFLKIPLSATELMSLLVGRLPEKVVAEGEVYRVAPLKVLYVIEKKSALLAEIDESTLLVRSLEIPSKLLLSSDGLIDKSGLLFPQKLNIDLPKVDTKLRLTFASVEANVALSEALFNPPIPAGFDVSS